MLRAICCFIHHGSISTDQWSEIFPYLAVMDREVVAGDGIQLDIPAALVAAARGALHAENLRRDKQDRSTTMQEIFRAGSRKLSTILDEDQETLYETLGSIGALNQYNDSYKAKIREAAEQVRAEPETFSLLIEWLGDELRQDVKDNASWFQFWKSDLLLVVAAAAEMLPNTFLNEAQKITHFPRFLREAAEFNETFTGRQAAILLLSYLRMASGDALGAIKCGLRDVQTVQERALASIDRYRDIDRSFLESLLEELYQPVAKVLRAPERAIFRQIKATDWRNSGAI